MSTTTAKARPLHVIAAEISRDWTKPYFGAVPYINALHSISSIDDKYWLEEGRDIVERFLANCGKWRGETARRVKAELKAMLAATS